jgi:hypothetical protein
MGIRATMEGYKVVFDRDGYLVLPRAVCATAGSWKAAG